MKFTYDPNLWLEDSQKIDKLPVDLSIIPEANLVFTDRATQGTAEVLRGTGHRGTDGKVPPQLKRHLGTTAQRIRRLFFKKQLARRRMRFSINNVVS